MLKCIGMSITIVNHANIETLGQHYIEILQQ